MLRIGSHELGVRHAINIISHAEAGNHRPCGNDFTREIRAQRQGQRLRQSALTGPDPAVPWTDAHGFDLDEDDARTGIRPRDSLEPHDLWRSVLMHAPGHHRWRGALRHYCDSCA